MPGNWPARFLGEGAAATSSPYPTRHPAQASRSAPFAGDGVSHIEQGWRGQVLPVVVGLAVATLASKANDAGAGHPLEVNHVRAGDRRSCGGS